MRDFKLDFSLNKIQLQTIAIIAMVIDHISWAFLDFHSPIAIFMHVIGRLSIPIMCFFIAEGFKKSHSTISYMKRLAVFAVISVVPFYLFFGEIYGYRQNIIFDYLLALIFVMHISANDMSKTYKALGCCAIILVSIAVGGWVIMPCVFVLIFHFSKTKLQRNHWYIFSVLVLVAFVSGLLYINSQFNFYNTDRQWYDFLYLAGFILALPLINSYNGEKGNMPLNRYFFYIFYPAHLLVLWGIKELIIAGHIQQIYITIHVIALISILPIIYFTLKSTPSKAQNACLVMVIAGLFYLLAFLGEIITENLGQIIASTRIQYFAQFVLLMAFSWFLAEYNHKKLPNWIILAECFMTFVLSIAVITMGKNDFFYTKITIDYNGPFPKLLVDYGQGFYLYILYTLVITVTGIIVTYKNSKINVMVQKQRTGYVIGALLCPWLATIIRSLGLTGGYEITSLGALATIYMMIAALFRHNYFNTQLTGGSSAMDSSSEGMMILDTDMQVQYINRQMIKYFPKLSLYGPTFMYPVFEDTLNGKKKSYRVDNKILDIRVQPIKDKDIIQSYAVSTLDMTEYYEEKEKLIAKAHTDALTGVFDRAYYKQKIEESISDGHTGALMMLDLDNFKGINDNYGHEFGDLVIKACADMMKSLSLPHLNCRIGGDEFSMYVYDIRDQETLELIAKEAIDQFSQRIAALGHPGSTGVSIGIASVTSKVIGSKEPYEVLYRNADNALYSAKTSGKNVCKYYSK